jgi:RND family efflux transporter MFP subunit
VATGVEIDGVVEPLKQSLVSSQATGRVSALVVKAGDHVKAGQLLATVDDRETQTGVQRSQAQQLQSDSELRNAQLNVSRTRDLQAKGFVSQAALDTAELQFKAAQAGRDQASAGSRQSALSQEFTRVTAPYEGYVSETLVQAGDLAVPGKPLLNMYSPHAYRVVVHVGVSQQASTRAAVQVEVQQAGGEWIKPLAQQLMPAADALSQTLQWRLDVPNMPGVSWVPGQQVRVRFVGGASQRITLPATAVLRRGELTAVYVAGGPGFVMRVVRLGRQLGQGQVEVLAGLLPQDRVAVDPVQAGLLGAQPEAPASTPNK